MNAPPATTRPADHVIASPAIGVLKLGGSLFDHPAWPHALARWLVRQPASNWVLVAGGGPWADSVRRWDQPLGLGEEYCHELCGKLMSLSADMVRRALLAFVGFPFAVQAAPTLAHIRRSSTPPGAPLWILDAGRYLLEESPFAEDALPRNWTVTSDSIAADVARRLQARELVLLKSRSAAADWTFERATNEGAVDAHFPHVAPRLPQVRWVNLSDPAQETVYLARQSGE